MKALRTCALLLVAGLVICSAQNDPVTPAPVPDSTTAKTTTSEPPPATTTTEATTTSTSPSTSTSTTTAPQTTTTVAPTTTAAPTTTSTAEPPKPTPVPQPDVGSWTYTNKTTNQTCVLTQMALQLNVTYLDADNKTSYFLYDVPKDARVANGSCGSELQYIELHWGSKNVLLISFTQNKTEHEFSLAGMKFTLDGKLFPNAKMENQTIELVNSQILFKTPMDMSYHCNRVQQLNLTSTDSTTALNSTVSVSKLQFEAFHKAGSARFSIAKDCDAIDTPDIVPIAVGCALILLIVIVLIAYLAGRRSTRNRGYVSM